MQATVESTEWSIDANELNTEDVDGIFKAASYVQS